MKIQEVKNGSLYFNRASQRVERVRSKANSNSVLTTSQGSNDVTCVPAATLRRASQQQFEKYLDAS